MAAFVDRSIGDVNDALSQQGLKRDEHNRSLMERGIVAINFKLKNSLVFLSLYL